MEFKLARVSRQCALWRHQGSTRQKPRANDSTISALDILHFALYLYSNLSLETGSTVLEYQMFTTDILYYKRPYEMGFTAHIGLLLLLCLRPALAAAKPLGYNVRRASDNSGGNLSPKIWVSADFFTVISTSSRNLIRSCLSMLRYQFFWVRLFCPAQP